MVRYPPWDPKANLRLCVGCPYCRDDAPDVACGCPCHEGGEDEVQPAPKDTASEHPSGHPGTLTMNDLTSTCAIMAQLLPIAQALTTQPDTNGTTGHGQPGSRPPWNTAAANAAMDAHAGIRTLEADLREAVTGHRGPPRGGSDTSTIAALDAIQRLANNDARQAMVTAELSRLIVPIEQLPAVDQAEPWRRIPAQCPYCGYTMLRVQARAGIVTCLRHGACRDHQDRHPTGRLDVSRITGDPLIRWADGLVTP